MWGKDFRIYNRKYMLRVYLYPSVLFVLIFNDFQNRFNFYAVNN